MIKITERDGVYVVQLKPENGLESTLLRDIQKAANGMTEQEYWTIAPQKHFLDESFTQGSVAKKKELQEENPFIEKEEPKYEQTMLEL